MSEHTPAEKAAREIGEIDRRCGSHNEAWRLHVTGAVQAAIDEDNAKTQRQIDALVRVLREAATILLQEDCKYTLGRIQDALAPFKGRWLKP